MTDQAQTDAELLEELKKVGTDLVFRQKTRRIMRRLMALTTFTFVISVISILAYVEVRDVQIAECRRDNELRKAYVDQWRPILADSPKPQKPAEDAPIEVKEAYERQIRSRTTFEKSLNTGWAQRKC